jgi:hypothetical protein
MHCFLSVVSILIDFGYMHVCDWASHAFLPMIPYKGCTLAKIQHISLSSLIRVSPHHFTYDTVLRDPHCERPKKLALSKAEDHRSDIRSRVRLHFFLEFWKNSIFIYVQIECCKNGYENPLCLIGVMHPLSKYIFQRI